MRQVLALVFILAPALAAAQSSDPAYVDSPQSKAVPDPARTDRGSGSAQAMAAQEYSAEQAQMQAEQAERMAEVERNMREQVEQITAAHTAARQAQQGGLAESGPPIGGRSLLRQDDVDQMWRDPFRQQPAPTQPGAGRQIGSALLQDAGGLLDARLQRERYGDGGRVYLPEPSEPAAGP